MDRRTALLSLLGATTLAVPGAGLLTTRSAAALGFGTADYRTTALMGGEFAIQTSQIALEKARSRDVRGFAELEIAEQTGIAASLGTRPGGVALRPDQAQIVQELSAMPPGARFDMMYVKGQIIGHQELLALNTGALQSPGGDPVVLAVANIAVPSIQTHLVILERLARASARS
jgi:putative membrane protein